MFRISLILLVLSQLMFAPASSQLAPEYYESPVELEMPYSTIGEATEESLAYCENLVAQALAVLPEDHVEAIHNLTLSFDSEARRGLAGGNTLILRCTGMSDQELVAVLIHEVGHVVDTGLLQAENTVFETSTETPFVDRGQIVYSSDPSIAFYGVSWLDNSSLKTEQNADFVSGYADSNPYEDFAESYVAYVLQGDLFRSYAAQNSALAEKYEFLKTEVFDGVEFDLTSTLSEDREVDDRHYDITRLDYDLKSFLSLRGII